MKFSFAFITLLASGCISQRAPAWTIDKSCDTYDNQNIREKIKDSVLEGLKLAEDAVGVMRDHADDPWVQEMSKLVLGRRDGFETRFEATRQTLERVAAFERAPSNHLPLTDEWKSMSNNRDWEIYCNDDRLTKDGRFTKNAAFDDRALWPDTVMNFRRCYATEFQSESGIKMSTLPSDIVDKAGYMRAAFDGSPRLEDYTTESIYPTSTDFCSWFLEKAYKQGFPQIDNQLLEMVKSDGFRAGFTHGVPVDGLKTVGFTFLHELTHTSQAGTLKDLKELPPGIPSCYNWYCVTKLALEPSVEAERNSDSVAMLALALRVWKMKHYVDADGVIHEIPRA